MKRWISVIIAAPLLAQEPSMRQVLERLERLEKENSALRQEVRELRDKVAALQPESAATAPAVQQLEERLAIQEKRTEEQAQTKVEASQRFPVRLSGTLLANAFKSSSFAGELDQPTVASRVAGRKPGGLSFRQTVIGFEFTGSNTFLGATAKGSAFFDFFDTQTEATPFAPVRFRTGGFELNWKTRSIGVMQEKTLVAIRDPDSLSYSGISPLTAAGNLWRWQPHLRLEQRFGGSADNPAVRAQLAIIQTNEESNFPLVNNFLFSRRRPGVQGRVQFAAGDPDGARVEVAPMFHVSDTLAEGRSLRSDVAGVDWLVAPHRMFRWSGVAWTGQAVHHFGSMRQSYARVNGLLVPVKAKGGWMQISIPFTSKFSFNTFGGIHDDANTWLARTAVAVNRTGAFNFMYRLAPNMIVSLELMQQRTTYIDIGNRKNNRYDLSIAYLF